MGCAIESRFGVSGASRGACGHELPFAGGAHVAKYRFADKDMRQVAKSERAASRPDSMWAM
jgi:hypothetical protein